ncbi:Cytosolic fatty-acid binding domain and Calycin-like domain and Calycin domain-containing protein [Strongyloides ratti]|uniref:Cytosolic fatty-acid binding domain and Calycin-like domain and Calycin domain-containing protein n=1 Tax=Strongyloides ratti TaxID=34506 RepID=A0A090LPK0_STRRB|nr:Cytosolic fatty-acid binding domain and Calycin-like domain and Calycin domain-containing protein [Strongyloides ratti]CEF69470.1 Cytosolic fatty-acid binding domain and Calycin-like domain and Calycin domain-containing protein [Strongyloides ratti]
MAEIFAGVWGNPTFVNFDAYLKEAGVNFVLRQLAKTVRDKTTITVNDVEEIQETIDGRKFLTMFTLKDGKLIETQKSIKSGLKESIITRYVEDNKLIVEFECNGVKAVNTYFRL